MNYVKIMMVKRDKREIEQLRDIIQSVATYELVGICDNGQDAVRGIAEKNPDIVILDEVLPGKDVLEIAESVIHNKNLKNVKFILCGSKTHKQYLDFIYYKIADRLILRLLDLPYDDRKVREVIDDVMKAKRNDNYQNMVEPEFSDQEKLDAERMEKMKLQGFVNESPAVIQKMDHTCNQSLPVKLDKNGDIKKSENVVSADQIRTIMELTRENIEELGSQIAEGKIAIEPYKNKSNTGCDYCEFKNICHFDVKNGGNQYRRPDNEKLKRYREE